MVIFLINVPYTTTLALYIYVKCSFTIKIPVNWKTRILFEINLKIFPLFVTKPRINTRVYRKLEVTKIHNVQKYTKYPK